MRQANDNNIDTVSLLTNRQVKSDDNADNHYDRLRQSGRWFWTDDMMPEDLHSEETKQVLDTKSEFVSTLEESSSKNLVANLMESDAMSKSLTIRHCMLTTDIGMETIDRAADYIAFNDITEFDIQGDTVETTYELRWLGNENDTSDNISNKDIKDDNEDLLYDICTLLCFGESIDSFKNFPTFDRCKLGTICGDEGQIADYFADLYVLFSPQTRGRVAVKKGKIAENLVGDMLEGIVDASPNLSFADDSRVQDVPSEGEDQQFDHVVKVHTTPVKYIAIECAFQETTNSVIERKARQSRELYPSFVEQGHFLCYAVGGAGYYKRSKALKQMVKHSDLSVGFDELDQLQDLVEIVSEQA